ncbi:membrane protein, partial [Sphingomonas sanguinis]
SAPAAFDAFWFANFTSITLRRGYPAAKIIGRLAGIGGQLLPLIACAVFAWAKGPTREGLTLTRIWLAFALVAFAMIGAFFDHYALPLVAPLAMAAAPAFAMRRRAVVAVFVIGAGLFVLHAATNDPSEGDGIRRMARVMAAVDGRECPYVFAGDSSLYHLSGGCVPTPYAFPSSLAYEAERGAIGIDEAAEVARILARRPPAIVTLDDPFSPWNEATQGQIRRALASDYRLVLSVPREGRHELLYVRRDLAVPPVK